jgi:hypothetical protein
MGFKIRLPKISAPKINVPTAANVAKNFTPIGRSAGLAKSLGITKNNVIDSAANFLNPSVTMPALTQTMKGGGSVQTQVQPDMGIGTRGIGAQISYDEQGRPIRNNYQSVLNDKGGIQNAFSLANRLGDDVSLNTQAADSMRSRATAVGPSVWAQLAEQNQRLQESQALNNNMVNAQANTNRGFNQLASRGGLSAGQRERLAMQGQRQALSGQQGILNQGMQSRLNLGMQDEQMKNQLLGQSAQADLANANFRQGQRAFNVDAQRFDLNNALNDVRGLNAYNAGAFGEAMREWGTGKTADAQAQAARSSGGKK